MPRVDRAARENDKHLALDHALDRIRVLEAELSLLRDVAEAADRYVNMDSGEIHTVQGLIAAWRARSK